MKIIVNLVIYSAFIVIARFEHCVHEWRPYTGNDDPVKFGLAAGTFKEGITAYVGRAVFYGDYVPGRLQVVEPTGLYHPSLWRVHRIVDVAEYLVNNASQSYEWINTCNAVPVESVVITGFLQGRHIWYIARVQLGEFSYIGKADATRSAHYEDGNAKEIPIDCYQLLTCSVKCLCH